MQESKTDISGSSHPIRVIDSIRAEFGLTDEIPAAPPKPPTPTALHGARLKLLSVLIPDKDGKELEQALIHAVLTTLLRLSDSRLFALDREEHQFIRAKRARQGLARVCVPHSQRVFRAWQVLANIDKYKSLNQEKALRLWSITFDKLLWIYAQFGQGSVIHEVKLVKWTESAALAKNIGFVRSAAVSEPSPQPVVLSLQQQQEGR